MFENNQATIKGLIIGCPGFSHKVLGEKFYSIEVIVARTGDNSDTIPVTISERMADLGSVMFGLGNPIEVQGQFRSHNTHDGEKNRLLLSVFAREISFPNDEEPNNNIFLDGFICKPPTYRDTPLGRKIIDILLAVNRPYGKSDYIPCICWGRNATYARTLDVGDQVQVSGRIQSREYRKRIGETEYGMRTAYEVSVSRIDAIEEEVQES